MEKVVLILYNVKAGRGAIRRHIDKIEQIFAAAGYAPRSQVLRFGQNPFDEQSEGVELVVVCGGDGTINYVVNAMRNKGLNYPMGIIPVGTANDFAKALGMSVRPAEAAQQIVDGQPRSVDCGRVNDLYFINIFSFGMFTTTSQHTPDKIKRQIGKAAYIIEGSKELHNREFIPLHIEHDGGVLDIDSSITMIFNGETAGGFPLARNASVNDGMLDLIILRKCSVVKGAVAAVRYLINGATNEEIVHIRSSKLTITSPLTPLTDMDGQPSAEFPLDIECLAGALTVIVPKPKQ